MAFRRSGVRIPSGPPISCPELRRARAWAFRPSMPLGRPGEGGPGSRRCRPASDFTAPRRYLGRTRPIHPGGSPMSRPDDSFIAVDSAISTRRIRAGFIIGVAALAGIATGLTAASASGPFAALRPHTVQATAPARLVAPAAELFPSPTPVVIHKTVDVYDPPPPAPVTYGPAPEPQPATTQPPEPGGGGV